MVRDKELSELVERALKAVAPEIREIAREGGFKYQTFTTWRRGTRTPSEDRLEEIAALLDARADRIRGLAAELRSRAADADD